jgi:ankyrin repeat protein
VFWGGNNVAPLHAAVHAKDTDMIKFLLDHGANPDIQGGFVFCFIEWSI